LQEETRENIAEAVQKLASMCITITATLIDAAHLNPAGLEGLNEEYLHGYIMHLSIFRDVQALLSELEPDLLLAGVGPATAAGITRRSAHSLAFAVAGMVYRAVWKASNPSSEPPQSPTSAKKLSWNMPAIRQRLQKIERFDAALLTEMLKQEAVKTQQIRGDRREAERRAKELAMIDEMHRTTRTKTEVATICGVNPRTVDRWIKSGKLRCVETEGKCIFDVREIELLSNRKKTTKPVNEL